MTPGRRGAEQAAGGGETGKGRPLYARTGEGIAGEDERRALIEPQQRGVVDDGGQGIAPALHLVR